MANEETWISGGCSDMLIGVVIGVYPSYGLGDLLQYFTAAMLIRKHLRDVKLSISIPNADLAQLQLSKLTHNIINIEESIIRLPLFKRRKTYFSKNYFKGKNSGKTESIIPKKLKLLACSSVYPALSRAQIQQYDIGIIGGHSIDDNAVIKSGVISAITFYKCARAIVRGVLAIFPCSVTERIFKLDERMLRTLKSAINKVDVVFVRGYYSEAVVSKLTDVSRVVVSPDTSFAIRPVIKTLGLNPVPKSKEESALRLTIVPRKEYFFSFNAYRNYVTYLRALRSLIQYAKHIYGAKIAFTPYNLKLGAFSDIAAMRDAVRLLSNTSKIEICIPKNLFEGISIIASSDIVITSRLHAGLVALSYGIPTIFVLPKNDVRVRDVFTLLDIDLNTLFIDILNSRSLEEIPLRVAEILENIEEYKSIIRNSVNKVISKVELSAKLFAKLVS